MQTTSSTMNERKEMQSKLKRVAIIKENAEVCEDCGLCVDRTQVVLQRGSPTAKVMIVGEAPGEKEDLEGLPFVGRSGQLLDSMLEKLGVDPDLDVYVTNACLCRPLNNRTPTSEEINTCRQYLQAQIAVVQPRVIVAMGKTAAFALGQPEITPWRGQWGLYGGTPVISTYHPSYVLRMDPESKKKVAKAVMLDLRAAIRKAEEDHE